MIDLNIQKHFAIQHAHNTTGFFTTRFNGINLGETKLNPSLDGVTFFRMQGEKDPKKQVAWYKEIHTALSNVGGLDGVIVFGDNMGSSLKQGLAIAQETKRLDNDIQTILLNRGSRGLINKLGVLSKQVDIDIQDQIEGRDINFTITPGNTTFDAKFDEDQPYADPLKHSFELASHLDVVIARYSQQREEFLRVVGAQPISPLANESPTTWSSKAHVQYCDDIPALYDIEGLVNKTEIQLLKMML